MNVDKRYYVAAAAVVLACGLLMILAVLGPGIYRLLSGSVAPRPDFDATLQALISGTAKATAQSPSGVQIVPPSTSPAAADGPTGHIVFTCQMFKDQGSEQICIMNADGTGKRRLTEENGFRHYYPSLAPDGTSAVYSQYREPNIFEIYEQNLTDGTVRRLTDRLGALNGPEISPDGESITFKRWTAASNEEQIWVMDRNGENQSRVFGGTGWDPTWSPDGTQILFASDMGGAVQLYTVKVAGSDAHRITDLPAIRGRSDWSPLGMITTYSGAAWHREIYIMQADGSGVRQVTPSGGNSQGPSFSPDGLWIAFTAYFDHLNDIHGCEIYIIRTDGTDLRRLTDNEYCDYQPRWGP